MMMIAIESAEERDIDIDDVTAAFLECVMTEEVHIYGAGTFAYCLLIEIYPEAKEFVNPDGTLVVFCCYEHFTDASSPANCVTISCVLYLIRLY